MNNSVYLKQALNEIREYINMYDDLSKELLHMKQIPTDVKKNILKIIDKVLGSDNNEK